MRVVVAPDSFGGTLTSVEAARAIATGWGEVAPDDVLDLVPLSDGGPGFVDVVQAGLGGEMRSLSVPGPLGAATDARWLRVGTTSYVEAAQACGLHLVAPSDDSVRRGHTTGLGALVLAAAVDAERVVVGLGGTATNDGGAGVVRALGHQLLGPSGAPLPPGADVLRSVVAVDPAPLRWPYDAELTAATDVDNPLLGPNGASAVYGPQKGADRAAVLDLDDALRRWADVVEPACGRPGLRDEPGAGAAGGIGFALLALGATRASGLRLVAEAVGLADRVAAADLVVTGEGTFDSQSLRGKVVAGVAAVAQQLGVPCVVVAGQVSVGRRDAAAAGIDEAVAVAEAMGSAEAAIEAGAGGVAAAAARVARGWSRRRS
ncbi:MAG TPA: glycerate kinase [Mycobacteriales bacterium]|nr:glycerate kinase [Mycobacteriales bacterium]